MLRVFSLPLSFAVAFSGVARATDLESFFFNDADGTLLSQAANTANPGNAWFYDPDTSDDTVSEADDLSAVQSGDYRVITDGNFAGGTQESRYLDIANVASGTVYLTATLSDWNFEAFSSPGDPPTPIIEQVRFGFLDNDTGTSGSTVTAQMLIVRDPNTGAMTLAADAAGTAGSFDIANTVDLPDNQTVPFTMVLAVDKDSDSYEVFYKDGNNPTQVLGLGGVSRVRDANSVRVVTDDFGLENFPPFAINEEVNIDSIVVSDTNPLTDVVTLEVDRVTGAMTLVNNSGAAVTGVTGVSLSSASGSVDLSDFNDFNGVLGDGQTAPLDSSPGLSPGLWIRNPVEDVTAELTLSGGGARTLDVDFVGNGGVKWTIGDLDFDGAVDADDYAILAANAETTLPGVPALNYQRGDLNGDGLNDFFDFDQFKDDFIAANSAAAFAKLLARVPEPGAATLLSAGFALLLGVRRRRIDRNQRPNSRTSHPMTPRYATALSIAATLVALSSSRTAEAVVLHEFLFDDASGTAIEAAANNVDALTLFDADADSAGVLTNGLGQLDLSGKDNDSFGSHYIDIEPGITTGTVYGVLEATWDFDAATTPAADQTEELRISLIANNPRSTFVTAQVEIERTVDDEVIIFGQAFGAGIGDGAGEVSGTIPAVTLNGGSLTQTETFVAVIEADLDNDTYEIFFSPDGGASFQSIGSAAIDSSRGVESARLVINNDFSDDTVLIDSFLFAQDELPFELDPAEPDRLTLQVNTTSGTLTIVNDTETSYDTDYYKISSADDSLLVADWKSLQDQAFDAVDGPDGGSTAGDGTGEVWTEAGGSDAGVLSESFLLSSSVISSATAPLVLGPVFDVSGDTNSLTFEYRDAATGTLLTGNIEVVTNLPGDFNDDGRVDAADYTVWRDNLGLSDAALNGNGTDDATGLVVVDDYVLWKSYFGTSALPGTRAASEPIPEPAAAALVLLAVASWAPRSRGRA